MAQPSVNRTIFRRGCMILGCLLLMTPVPGFGSELAQQVQAIFTQNRWSKMQQWLPEHGRLYVRIPNLQSGFLTAEQARALFREMEQRFATRAFSLETDTGSKNNRWAVRARWEVYDRNHDRTYRYDIEVGWEYRNDAWRLLVLQAQ